MKTVELNNLQVPVLLAEIPEGWTIGDKSARGPHTSTSVHGEHIGRQRVWYFPKGYELVGRLVELTEDQLADLVPRSQLFKGYFKCAKGGETDGPELAFETWVVAAGYYWENPYPDPPDIVDANSYHENEDWQAAQDKVLDRERIYVFKKVK